MAPPTGHVNLQCKFASQNVYDLCFYLIMQQNNHYVQIFKHEFKDYKIMYNEEMSFTLVLPSSCALAYITFSLWHISFKSLTHWCIFREHWPRKGGVLSVFFEKKNSNILLTQHSLLPFQCFLTFAPTSLLSGPSGTPNSFFPWLDPYAPTHSYFHFFSYLAA